MSKNQIYASLIYRTMRKHNGLTLMHLYVYAFLLRLGLKRSGYVPRELALGELAKRTSRSRRVILDILKTLESAGWIFYLADSKHFHVNSQTKVRFLYAPDMGKITYMPNRTAMLNFKNFEAWAFAVQCAVTNYNNYDARKEKEYKDEKGVPAVERKPNKGRLDRSIRKLHLGDLSCRYMSGVTGFSPAKSWRLRKMAADLKFIKVIPRFDEWADKANIRTIEQLEAYVTMCDDPEIHKKRFVLFEDKVKKSSFGGKLRYRMIDAFLVNTLKLAYCKGTKKSRRDKPSVDCRLSLSSFIDSFIQ